MTAIALPQRRPAAWNWPRVGALSGTLSLHVAAAVLLLVPPAAMTLLPPPSRDPIIVHVIEPPAKIEIPPLPQPTRIVHPATREPNVRPLVAPPTPPSVHAVLPKPLAAPPAPIGIESTMPVDVAPQALAYLTRSRIAYPREAAQRRQQGTVVLHVLVDAAGQPRTIEIEKSSGFRSLDEAARSAVARWKFQPGTREGVAKALWARVPIAFRLEML